MKAIVLLNGEPYRGVIDGEGATVYCCDGAYDWAKGRVPIDVNLGDYDSLSYLPDPPPAEIYPSEKDYTDGALALLRAIGAISTSRWTVGSPRTASTMSLRRGRTKFSSTAEAAGARTTFSEISIFCMPPASRESVRS